MASSPSLPRKVRRYADRGLSMSRVADLIGKSRSAVASIARRYEITFHGEQTVGGGCNSEQALRGWETRRARTP